ncbi:MAG: pyruvate, phosphate dikinase [Thermoanaerobaculia bacterium]
MVKYVYSFGGGSAEGRGDQKELLGGKGAGLAEMSGLGLPVPPGFTITTEVCIDYHRNGGSYPEGVESQIDEALERLEELQGRKFGEASDPLLLSVRSGGPVSMPGMMDTVLNLGLNHDNVDGMIQHGFDERFVRDCYRRLVSMYGNVVLGVPHDGFERLLAEARKSEGVEVDSEISAQGLADLTKNYLAYICEQGKEFPQDSKAQLAGAILAVVESWDNRRAIEYRRIHDLPEDSGTGVNVQTMVFGNRGLDCATGVAFSRDPATGERRLYGEYLVNAQGEDVVAGIRTPISILDDDDESNLGKDFPEAFAELNRICEVLEDHRHEMQDVEFTIESGKLYMLQTRHGKRTGLAAVRIAHEMVGEGRIDPIEALRRVEGEQLMQMLAPSFDPKEKQSVIDEGGLLAKGLAAGPGAASGRIALTADRAAEMASEGPVILVREETSPEDIVGMHASAGILTSRGGMTSHAAVVARGLGKPCIVGAGDLDVHGDELRVAGQTFREGDYISMDGTVGQVLAGELHPRASEVIQTVIEGGNGGDATSATVEAFSGILEYADGRRRMKVRANADTPDDARVARALGAEGIGLCRTEHMFFEEDRISWVRRLILSQNEGDQAQALAALLPMQQGDFEGIFGAMDGLPVTVRLLDPPLHEFLPNDDKSRQGLADQMGVSVEDVERTAESLSEFNPMLGNRGCRLGLTSPAIYDMQVEAIARAAAKLVRAGKNPRPEIMVPLVGSRGEMQRLQDRAAEVVARVLEEVGTAIEIPIGTMIEIPRAALIADDIARHADFFSFGTNDLTQMAFGYSRDDSGRFLPLYVEDGVLPFDPFEKLDQEGVGQLVEMGCRKGREVKPELKIGICGEHGGEPSSIEFFEKCGLDYVSCSPYRVPVARLSSARARIEGGAPTD